MTIELSRSLSDHKCSEKGRGSLIRFASRRSIPLGAWSAALRLRLDKACHRHTDEKQLHLPSKCRLPKQATTNTMSLTSSAAFDRSKGGSRERERESGQEC